jgi:hypothetical protein
MFRCTTAVDTLSVSYARQDHGRDVPRLGEILIVTDQSSNVLVHLARGLALHFGFQELVDDPEKPRLTFEVVRRKDQLHPFDCFVPEDQGRVSVEQATEGDTGCVLKDRVP